MLRTIKKCQKTAMLLHGISDTSYNPKQRMLPTSLSMSESVLSSLRYMVCIYRYLRPDMHKNQLQRNLSTISCTLSTNHYHICIFLIIIFKIFQVFLCFTILTFQTGLKDFVSFISFCSLTTEEHTPSWILVPDDGLLAYRMAAIRISSLTEQPKTWPEGHRKR